MRHVTLALLAAVGLLVTAVPSANAGVYTVHACKRPDNGPATLADWTLRANNEALARFSDNCPRGSFSMELLPNVAHSATQELEATFRAPPGTTIEQYAVTRTARATARYNYYFQELVGASFTRRLVAHCSDCTVGVEDQPDHFFNVLAGGGREITGLQFNLTCGGSSGGPDCPAADPTARLQIARATMMLRDDTAPTLVASPTGSLIDTQAPLSGLRYAAIKATDVGGGVYEALVELDGQVVSGGPLDPNDGRCRLPFTTAAPCKPSVDGTLAFDTSRLSDGKHALRLLVTDATGTNTAAWGPIEITTSNTPKIDPCDPRPRVRPLTLSASVTTRRRESRPPRSVTRRYGRRVRLGGRLTTPAGKPVAGARLCVATRNLVAGAPLRPIGSVVTDSDGRFSHTLRRGPSRRVYFVHRVPGGAVVSTVVVNVQAPVSLLASRRRLRNGQTVVLRGKARGRPVPAGGLVVEIQARRATGWQTFGTTRTRRSGRFRFRYRFTRTTGVQRYRLRARVPGQSAYPYTAGGSRSLRLTVWR